MHRSLKCSAVFVACALLLVSAGACSSSDKTPTIATVVGSGGVGAMPVTACSLATGKQVKNLLGVESAGRETDFAEYYKTCDWAGSGTEKMSVKIIRMGEGQVGFGSTRVGLNAVELTGIGDKATYSTGVNREGLNESLLVTNKGIISLVVDVNRQTAPDPESVKDDVTDLATSIFTALRA